MDDLHHLGRDGARENERNVVPGKKNLSDSMRDSGNDRSERPGLERVIIFEKWDKADPAHIDFDSSSAFEKVLKRIDGAEGHGNGS